MAKLTGRERRKQRREEERRLLAEFDEAVAEERAKREGQVSVEEKKAATPNEKKKRGKENFYQSTTPETLHCRRCKTLMENGVCPTCGYKTYVPMSEEKRKKARWIVTVACVVIFVILFAVVQAK